ncbi:hypothetical protein BDZ94DRAFT_1263077, partial [Collybia nuda]
MFLHFDDHPEPEIATGMVERLEKQWKACDQPVFILALILNPYEGLSRFGSHANLNHFKCNNLLLSVHCFQFHFQWSTDNLVHWQLYHRMKAQPSNDDTSEMKSYKERMLSQAFMNYLAGSGPFANWEAERAGFEEIMGKDPIFVWKAFRGSDNTKELASFAITLLTIVVNQAGCERLFS